MNNLEAMRPSIQTAIEEAVNKIRNERPATDLERTNDDLRARVLGDPTKGVGLKGAVANEQPKKTG
jgi:hypothetical protein